MDSNTHSMPVPAGLGRLTAAVDDLAAQDLTRLPDGEAAQRVLVLRRLLGHLHDVADPEGAEARVQHQHQRRGLWLSATLAGMVAIDGLLEPEAGGTLLAALEPLARPASAEDDRSGSQRRADALAELARQSLEGGRRPLPRHPRRRGRRRPARPATRRDRAAAPALGGAPREPLEVGRTTRVVSPAQRTALAVRDGGCVVPGCDRPPAWCEAHHLRHWLRGGPTDLENLVLLCRAHHRAVHEGHQHLHRRPTAARAAGDSPIDDRPVSVAADLGVAPASRTTGPSAVVERSYAGRLVQRMVPYGPAGVRRCPLPHGAARPGIPGWVAPRRAAASRAGR